MVGSFCLVRTILKPLISDGDCIWVWIFGEGGHRHRDFFSLLIHKSYFIPYVVNYEVGITLMSSDCMYYYFWDTLFSVHYVVRTQKKVSARDTRKWNYPQTLELPTQSPRKKHLQQPWWLMSVVTLKFSKSTALLQARKKVKVVGLKKPEQFNIRRDGQTWYPKQQ